MDLSLEDFKFFLSSDINLCHSTLNLLRDGCNISDICKLVLEGDEIGFEGFFLWNMFSAYFDIDCEDELGELDYMVEMLNKGIYTNSNLSDIQRTVVNWCRILATKQPFNKKEFLGDLQGI